MKTKLSYKHVEDFAFAGKAVFEIKKDKTKIVLKVTKGKNPKNCPNFDKIFFVSVKFHNTYFYAGHIKRHGLFKEKTGYISYELGKMLSNFFYNVKEKDLGGWKVYHFGRCGHCGNTLFGEDLKVGIGKSCRKEIENKNVQLQLKFE